MTPTTFEALAIGVLALLPGALFIWGFERQTGKWGIGLSDRLIRFFGVSAVLHVIAAPATFKAYKVYISDGTLAQSEALPSILWLGLIAYVAVPTFLGGLTARAHDIRRWVDQIEGTKGKVVGGTLALLVGRNPAPTGWDHLFASDPVGWVRVKLRDGTWLGGLFYDDYAVTGHRAYASGHGEEPGDLYLHPVVPVDPQTGAWPDVYASELDWRSGLLIMRSEITALEFKHVRDKRHGLQE